MWAVVPVKPLELAKQRLSGVCTPRQRGMLATAMLRDVLTVLSECVDRKILEGILVITRDANAVSIAVEHRASVLRDDSSDLCSALELGANWLTMQQATSLLVVPGDVPGLTLEAVAHIQHREEDVVVVPDRDGVGTNALKLKLPRAIPFLFGENSCRAHLDAAKKSDASAIRLQLASLALDIDTPDDLRELQTRNRMGNTGALIEQWATRANGAAATTNTSPKS